MRDATRQAIFQGFAEEMQGNCTGLDCTGLVDCTVLRWKEMVDCTGLVDVVATRRCIGVKTSPANGLTNKLFQQVLATVFTGSIFIGDRRVGACKTKQTTEHPL